VTQQLPRLERLELVERLTGEVGQKLVVLPWWRDAFTALDDPGIQELILHTPRQTGKSQCLAAMMISELFKPGTYGLFVSASETQAGAIYRRKLRRPLERLARALGLSRGSVHVTKRGAEVAALGSALEIIAPNEATAPARSPSLLLLDECRDIPDEVFLTLAPSILGAGGKFVLASTSGRPSGFFYEAVQHPSPKTWVYSTTVNDNPMASTPGVLDWLSARLGLVSPGAAARELRNEFMDDGDTLLPAALIAAAVDSSLGERPGSRAPAFAFLDLSRKRDLTSLVVVIREAARVLEAPDHLVAASILVWDPKQAPTGEVNFAEVRAACAALPERFPALERLYIDEGAEAGTVLPFARQHPALGARVQGFVASPESNMAVWSALAARFHQQSLSIPRHERLLAELYHLRQESFTFGSRWRVVDSSRKFHRDVSFALAGVVFAATERPTRPELYRPLSTEELLATIPREPDADRERREREQRERNAEILEGMIRSGVAPWFRGGTD
jgi:hypothetical protein